MLSLSPRPAEIDTLVSQHNLGVIAVPTRIRQTDHNAQHSSAQDMRRELEAENDALRRQVITILIEMTMLREEISQPERVH